MTRHRLALALLASGVAFAAPAAGFAATAEEAVAYTLMGLADGATFERATTKMEWTEASASPAVFDGKATIGGKPADIRFTVTSLDACHYEVTLQGPMVPSGGKTLYAKVDLTAVDGVAPAPDALHVDITGGGFCETGRTNRDCMVVNRSDLFGFVEAERHGELVAFLREDVCPAKE